MSKQIIRSTIKCPKCRQIIAMPSLGDFQCTACNSDFILCADGAISPISLSNISSRPSVNYRALVRSAQRKSIQKLKRPIFRAIDASIDQFSDYHSTNTQKARLPQFHKNYIHMI